MPTLPSPHHFLPPDIAPSLATQMLLPGMPLSYLVVWVEGWKNNDAGVGSSTGGTCGAGGAGGTGSAGGARVEGATGVL